MDTETADAVIHREFDRLRGRLAGLIESWGLPERQERGAVATLKSLSYDSEAALIEVVEDLAARM